MSSDRTTPELLDLERTAITDGTTIVEASAGTCKTYTLTALVLRLVLEKQLAVGQILVVTFTNAATEELSGRIRAALRDAYALFSRSSDGDSDADAVAVDPFLAFLLREHGGPQAVEALRRALLDFDELTISTIHGFCKRVLDESAFESGLPFDIEFLDSDDQLLLDAARDVWRRLTAGEALRRPLFAAWAAERGLEPGTFLKDFRAWRRHPRTRILPPPPSTDPDEATAALDEALQRVEQARRRLAERFDRTRLRLGLSRLKIRPGHELSRPERLKTVLAAADTFIQGGADGLWAVLRLGREALRGAVVEGKARDLERLTGLAEVDALITAFEDFEHVLRCAFLFQVERSFQAEKETRACLAFDDLLHRLHDALRDPRHGPRLRNAVGIRFKAALIDEFQDTDLIQYEIFKQLFQSVPLVLVGDPKQAIYGFRGADIFAYLLARRDARRAFTLARNWRSSEALIGAVNGLFADSPHPFVFDEIPFVPVQPAPGAVGRDLVGDGGKALEWLWLPEEPSRARAEAVIERHVAADIARLLNGDLRLVDGPEDSGRALEPGDIAVLVRTNAQAAAMQESLRRVGIPSVVGRSGDIFQSSEMDELLRLLDAVVDPARGERLRAACATLAWGASAEEIHRLQRDDGAFQRLVDRFDAYREDWQSRGFIAMMERLLQEQDVRHRLLALRAGERRLTNLQHAVEVLHQGIHDRGLGPAALVAWARAETDLKQHDRDAAELRLESDSMAVSLVTVHKSKGLEYEVVYCPFLWAGRALREAPVTAHVTPSEVVYDCGSRQLDTHLALADAERLAEDLRLTYVALTRAKRRCVVVWGDIGRGGASADSAPAYLLHRRQLDLPVLSTELSGPEIVARRVASETEGIRARRDAWPVDLQDLVDRHPQTMALRILEGEPQGSATLEPVVAPDRVLQARSVPGATRRQMTAWRLSSFSSLVRDGARESPDHGEPEPAHTVAGVSASGPTDMAAFARGPRAGDCLHQIFEAMDFTTGLGSAGEDVIVPTLERFRLHRGADHGHEDLDPAAAVGAMVERVLDAELPAERFSLRAVPRADRLVEWQFFAPLEDLQAVELSDMFRAHGRGPWVADYADRLARLSKDRLEGFLTGYVDLVFEHGGRWFIVDWKSNYLGPQTTDYGVSAMTRVMDAHHYFLQYHLYVVALHRYLKARLPDWDYERDFGGVLYVFLRGVEGAGESGDSPLDPIAQQPVAQQPVAQQPVAQQPVTRQSPGSLWEPGEIFEPEPEPVRGQLSLFDMLSVDPAPAEPAPVVRAPEPEPSPAPPAELRGTPRPVSEPRADGPTGIFVDRPPRALIEAMSGRWAPARRPTPRWREES